MDGQCSDKIYLPQLSHRLYVTNVFQMPTQALLQTIPYAMTRDDRRSELFAFIWEVFQNATIQKYLLPASP